MPRGERHTKATSNAEVSPVDNEAEVNFAEYADKPLTPTQEDLAAYLEANVGIDIDARSAALGARLYGYFQASEFNKTRTLNRREQKVADAEQAKADRAAAREEKAAAKAAKAEAEAPAEKPAPARRGRKPAAAKAEKPAAKPATRRGRKPATAGKAAAPF